MSHSKRSISTTSSQSSNSSSFDASTRGEPKMAPYVLKEPLQAFAQILMVSASKLDKQGVRVDVPFPRERTTYHILEFHMFTILTCRLESLVPTMGPACATDHEFVSLV